MKKIFSVVLIIIGILIHSVVFAQDDVHKQINECDSYVKKYREENNKGELLKYLNKLGFLYWQTQDLNKAQEIFKESIKLNEEIGNTNAVRSLCSNIGTIYIEKQDFENAITFLAKSIRLNRQMGKKAELLADIINVASAYQSIDKIEESSRIIEEGILVAKELNDMKSLRICYATSGENFQKKGDSNKAQEYFELAATLTRHLQKEQLGEYQKKTNIAEEHASSTEKVLRATTDTLQDILQINSEKQLQIDLLSKEKQLKDLQLKEQQADEKRRRFIIATLSLILILVGLSLLIIFKQLRDNKRANRLLAQSNEEINRQKAEIEEQHHLTLHLNQKVTDSIQYASRIQNAILPSQQLLDELIPDHFVIYRPKQIVSGDFYWMTKKDDFFIIAVADCTGHGVPGAFMSMLGFAFLNDIVNKIQINEHISTLHTDDILNQLRHHIIASLHQNDVGNENKDGMDIAICIIDNKTNTLEYSGAHNPLCIFRNDEMIILEADRLPVGKHPKADKPFTRHEMTLQKGDMIYMYTDGYPDQFGGAEKIKLTSIKFKNILTEIHKKPLVEQKEYLIKKHLEWKGSIEQLDDISIIGFKYGTESNLSSKTILIAEDMDINFMLLDKVLSQTKAHVIRVKNGKEALEFCTSNNVDLVLMDIDMPVMDGHTATIEIKKLNKNIPIIAQTAMHGSEYKDKMLTAGCVDFISKPIDIKAFMTIINKYI